MKTSILLSMFISLFSFSAQSDTVFEGYYKVVASNKPIGYYILRYEYEPKKKQFISKSFLLAKTGPNDLVESLTAVSDNKFHPISYKYTSKSGPNISSIDASFKTKKNGQLEMSLTKADGKTSQNQKVSLPAGTFLSTFQVYLMMQKGLKPGTHLQYKAISEEDGELSEGDALIKQEPGFEGKNIFRVLNRFKGSQFISNMTDKGEVLITESPIQKIRTELVAVPAEATKGFSYSVETLKLVFGDIPRGQANILAKNKKAQGSQKSSTPVVKENSNDSRPQQKSLEIKSSTGAQPAKNSEGP